MPDGRPRRFQDGQPRRIGPAAHAARALRRPRLRKAPR
jgi:hypothetical protein